MSFASAADERAGAIVGSALEGATPTEADVAYLLGFPPEGPEAALAIEAARAIGMKACGGQGYLYAQIGVDALPCPEQCAFCAFAACNSDVDSADAVVDTEHIVHYARLFDGLGMDLVSLMATSALDFEQSKALILKTIRERVDA